MQKDKQAAVTAWQSSSNEKSEHLIYVYGFHGFSQESMFTEALKTILIFGIMLVCAIIYEPKNGCELQTASQTQYTNLTVVVHGISPW